MRIFVLSCLLAAAFADPYHVAVDKVNNYGVDKEFVKKFFEEIHDVDPREISTTLNDYADEIFTNIQEFMIHSGLDPASMPEIHEGFNFTFIILYHGELDMTGGWLQDVSSIHRGGDVVVSYDHATEKLLVTIPISFKDMAFTYDYSAKLMGLGPKGGIEGKIVNLDLSVEIEFDFQLLQASAEFYILNSGHVSLHFSGNALIDVVLNILTEVASTALHRVILLIIEGIVRDPINSLVDAINQLINDILNPPSTTTTAEFGTDVPYLNNKLFAYR